MGKPIHRFSQTLSEIDNEILWIGINPITQISYQFMYIIFQDRRDYYQTTNFKKEVLSWKILKRWSS